MQSVVGIFISSCGHSLATYSEKVSVIKTILPSRIHESVIRKKIREAQEYITSCWDGTK